MDRKKLVKDVEKESNLENAKVLRDRNSEPKEFRKESREPREWMEIGQFSRWVFDFYNYNVNQGIVGSQIWANFKIVPFLDRLRISKTQGGLVVN